MPSRRQHQEVKKAWCTRSIPNGCYSRAIDPLERGCPICGDWQSLKRSVGQARIILEDESTEREMQDMKRATPQARM
jgi:hypothetical protein